MATSSSFVKTLCLASSIGLSVIVVGCSSTDSSDSSSRDTGTTGARVNTIPANARIVEEGRGSSDLSYTAREDGRIYVLDASDNRVVYSGRLNDGQRFVLSPKTDRATLDGRNVLDRDLKAHNDYRIYFDDGDTVGTARTTADGDDAVLSRSSDRDDVITSRNGDRDRTFSDIPRDAEMVEQGAGPLDYRAGRDGTIWVYDSDSDRIVYSGQVRDGDRFRLDDDNRGTINGKVVFEREPIRENHRYRVYFERD